MFPQETWRKMSDEASALALIRALAMRKRTSSFKQVLAFLKNKLGVNRAEVVPRHSVPNTYGESHYAIHHFCIIGWFPADKKSILVKQVTRTALRGVLVTCISNIDFLKLETSG